jgi:transcriptional regulator with XRE-family HTH domain
MATKRQGLIKRRTACGYSQEALAEQLRVDRTSIGRWERGETDPQPHIRPRLALLLKVTPVELDALLFPEAAKRQEVMTVERSMPERGTVRPSGESYLNAGDLDEMIRRQFLQLIGIASTVIPVSQAHPVIDNIQELSGLGGSASKYDQMNSHLWQVFSLSASKRVVYPVVRDQLAGLTDDLKAVTSQEQRRRLCAAAGNLFQIAGEIFFDSNRYTDSAHSYALAASASKEAGEYDLWACALTRHAFIGMSEHQLTDTVPLLDAAGDISRRGDGQLATRYWVAAAQAEVFARLGDFESCCRSLDSAEQVRSLTGEVHNGGWLRFDGSRVAEERGTCYVALGRPDLAEAALTDALKQPLSLRRRSSVLVDLAVLGIQRRDIDQLVSYAEAAIQLGRQTHSGYVGRKLQDLQGKLRPLLADRRVSVLSQQISELN